MKIGSEHQVDKSGSRRLNRRQPRMAAAMGCGAGAPAPIYVDLSLIHDVQLRATGANIHTIAQELQIYVSASECGATWRAQQAEAQLRAFVIGRR